MSKIEEFKETCTIHAMPDNPDMRRIAALLKERDDLKAELQKREAACAMWRGFIHRFCSVSSIKLSAEQARESADRLLCGSNCGQPLLDRLKEARELLFSLALWDFMGPNVEWCKRRNAFLEATK